MAIYKLRTEVTIEVPDEVNAGMASALRVFDKAMTDAFVKEPIDSDEGIRDYKHYELRKVK